ncbi:MAG: PilZ domain-containing protein [Treponema sp.]|uniref:PilZ domain-containing protein n=1 Tax=Treponema sp. TaxID=166 RepID=UPI001B50C1E6|nr:PilZ domain-containing protein [Treponema sp.]MBP5402860.1 PilZ domain-containing protein [Treponema sp.]MBR5933654.1 PilZ domain-containing protein [Treponema sp.]
MNGSPLAARQNPHVYLVILYLAIFIGIIFIFWLINKIIKKRHESPEYIEAQKQKPTTIKDVQILAKKIELTKEETLLLWKICKSQGAKNIFYSYTDEKYLDTIFKAEFRRLAQMRSSDKELYDLFRLRFRIEKYVSFARSITNSKNIPLGTILSYPAPSGFQYQFNLVKNEPNGLYLSVPDTLEESNEDRPENLKKLVLLFSMSKQQYAIVTRVVQFLNQPNGEKQVLITHSNTLCPQSRRASKRFVINRECLFSAAAVITKPDGELKYTPKENKYNGTVVDLSEGGCKMYTTLPIKKKQYIYIELTILGKTEPLFGQIMDTRTDVDTGLYSLHIAFKHTSLETKVKMLTELYDWS